MKSLWSPQVLCGWVSAGKPPQVGGEAVKVHGQNCAIILISLRFSLLSWDYNGRSVEYAVEVEKSFSCLFSTLSLKSKGFAISCWGSSSLHVFPDVSGHPSPSCSVQSVDFSLFTSFLSLLLPPACWLGLLQVTPFRPWLSSTPIFHLDFAAAYGLCQPPMPLCLGVLSLLTPGCLWNGWGTFPWETQCILKWDRKNPIESDAVLLVQVSSRYWRNPGSWELREGFRETRGSWDVSRLLKALFCLSWTCGKQTRLQHSLPVRRRKQQDKICCWNFLPAALPSLPAKGSWGEPWPCLGGLIPGDVGVPELGTLLCSLQPHPPPQLKMTFFTNCWSLLLLL